MFGEHLYQLQHLRLLSGRAFDLSVLHVHASKSALGLPVGVAETFHFGDMMRPHQSHRAPEDLCFPSPESQFSRPGPLNTTVALYCRHLLPQQQ